MLTTHRIQQHFESLEMERLRAEVKELHTRILQLQSELLEARKHPESSNHSAASVNSDE
ncbi:MAG: hypothetical protein KDA84_23510 [Planctomycetaceae bacterium]|nr:hypothetical protein [Planctomycetaceae bacterium]